MLRNRVRPQILLLLPCQILFPMHRLLCLVLTCTLQNPSCQARLRHHDGGSYCCYCYYYYKWPVSMTTWINQYQTNHLHLVPVKSSAAAERTNIQTSRTIKEKYYLRSVTISSVEKFQIRGTVQ